MGKSQTNNDPKMNIAAPPSTAAPQTPPAPAVEVQPKTKNYKILSTFLYNHHIYHKNAMQAFTAAEAKPLLSRGVIELDKK